MPKRAILFLLILLLGASLRFTFLDTIPHSVNGDEMHYLLSAKSFVLTGKDITQTITPLDLFFFRYSPDEPAQAELPYFLLMLTVGIFPFSLLGNALPNAFLSFLLIPLLYLIAKKLFNNTTTALLASFLTSINPWFIAMGRTSYEVIPATFFYLAGFYLVFIAKGWKILLSFPLFLLAFYSYIGTKLIFFPLILVFCLYAYFVINKRQFAKYYLSLCILSLIFVGFFLFQITTSSQSRTSEILSPFSPYLGAQVDGLRKATITSPLVGIFENKGTLFFSLFTERFIHSLSPSYLFITGDFFFLLKKHGLFYLIELFFLIGGAYFLFQQQKKLFFFFLTVCFIAILPQAVHLQNQHFTPHLMLIIPFFLLIISYGIGEVFNVIAIRQLAEKQSPTIKGALIITFSIFYLFALANFVHLYFFHIPLQPNFFNLSNRLLAYYSDQTENKQILVYSPDPDEKFKDYVFYNNALTKENAATIAKALTTKRYSINNVQFLECNRNLKAIDRKKVTLIYTECEMKPKKPPQPLVIPQPVDSGTVFRIYHDELCHRYDLKLFVSGTTINDLSLQNQTPQAFCEQFIIK